MGIQVVGLINARWPLPLQHVLRTTDTKSTSTGELKFYESILTFGSFIQLPKPQTIVAWTSFSSGSQILTLINASRHNAKQEQKN